MRIVGWLGAWRGLIISIALFALVVFGAARLLTNVNDASVKEQTEMVRSAVRRAAISCFAVEGRYPQTCDYLKENYGLMYDEDFYAVTYDAFASNIMPDIRVVRMGDSGEE